jgi:hypothetical protein
MPASIDWRDEKYTEVYDETLDSLERRRSLNRGFTIIELEGILTALYVQDGNDWSGRGALQDTILKATIAAHEHFLVEWKTKIVNEELAP